MNDVISLTKAFALACAWHASQRRKGKAREPYVNHLAEVAHLVTAATGGRDMNLSIAALLHDAIEDAKITSAQIEAEFGPEVAKLVLEVTDNKKIRKSRRKQLQVETTPSKSRGAKMIKLADKTSNLRAIVNSPPSWPKERKQKYLAWARLVVSGARGVNPELETSFDAAAHELECRLSADG